MGGGWSYARMGGRFTTNRPTRMATDEEIRNMIEQAYERGGRLAKEVPIMAIFDAFAAPDPCACKSMTSFIKTRGANYYLSDENREIEEFLVTRFCALKKGDKPKDSL
ncbi:hypothetical protein SO802_019776 [Lithocarpus litseifolius]|uniref:Uncharacterized protein n=1 Tax=Lithocarpus litseifolius TaxID=425828 RepID=A0AAW2CRQ8_9ROSI